MISSDMALAKETVLSGGTLLYPSDTLWGLGCDATNATAIDKLFQIKNRPIHQSFIVLVDRIARLEELVDIPDMAWEIMDVTDGPITIVYDAAQGVAHNAINADGSLAIRWVKSGWAHDLIRSTRRPLISTSANISGQTNASYAFKDIPASIKTSVDFVATHIDESAMTMIPSPIIKITKGNIVKVLR